jgi:hypothetical protein
MLLLFSRFLFHILSSLSIFSINFPSLSQLSFTVSFFHRIYFLWWSFSLGEWPKPPGGCAVNEMDESWWFRFETVAEVGCSRSALWALLRYAQWSCFPDWPSFVLIGNTTLILFYFISFHFISLLPPYFPSIGTNWYMIAYSTLIV